MPNSFGDMFWECYPSQFRGLQVIAYCRFWYDWNALWVIWNVLQTQRTNKLLFQALNFFSVLNWTYDHETPLCQIRIFTRTFHRVFQALLSLFMWCLMPWINYVSPVYPSSWNRRLFVGLTWSKSLFHCFLFWLYLNIYSYLVMW